MKKTAFFLILLINSYLYATPVGNPLSCEIIEEGFFIPAGSWVNVKSGYEGNLISDARLENRLNKNKIDNFKQDYNSATLTLNLQNRIDLYGLIGSSRIRGDWRFSSLGANYRAEIETDYKPVWAAGGRAILFEWGNMALGTGGRFSKTKPALNFITINGILQPLFKTKIIYQAWQVDLSLAYKIDIFIPYIGGKYLNAKSQMKKLDFVINDNELNEIFMKNKDRFGAFIGCSFSNGKYFMLTCEARFLDEEAVMVSGEIKF